MLNDLFKKSSRKFDAIYLISTAGHPNYGDEFITRCWLEALRKASSRTAIWLDTPNPGLSAQLFDDALPEIKCTDTVWRLSQLVSGSSAAEDWEARVKHFIAHLGTPRLDPGIAKLRDMELFHVLGGGYLNSIWPVNDLLATAISAVSAETAAPVVATGLGLLPQSTQTREVLSSAMSNFAFVESRDLGVEAQELSPAIVPGFDDAFLGLCPEIEGFWRKSQHMSPPQYMLLFQGDLHRDEDHRRSALDAAFEELGQAGWNSSMPLGLVEAIPPDDAAILHELRDERKLDIVFYPFMQLWQEGLPLCPGQYWVSTRFHFHLLAAASGIRGTAISISDEYYSPKHRSLVALGSGWKIIDTGGNTLCEAEPGKTATFPAVALRIGAAKRKLADLLLQKPVDPQAMEDLIKSTRSFVLET